MFAVRLTNTFLLRKHNLKLTVFSGAGRRGNAVALSGRVKLRYYLDITSKDRRSELGRQKTGEVVSAKLTAILGDIHIDS